MKDNKKDQGIEIIIIVSADAEWNVIHEIYPEFTGRQQKSPLGEWGIQNIEIGRKKKPVLFFHGGCRCT